MQMSRLFETVYILMHHNNISARYLSEHFEVSQRTIYRDVETLCQAGIPIYMQRGKGGGIRLAEHFVLDRAILSQEEKDEILASLQGMNLLQREDKNGALERLSMLFGEKSNHNHWIDVDFSGWGNCHEQCFAIIKQAILQQKLICFDYYNSKGEHLKRTVQPIQLWFKNKTWYLKGICLIKNAGRIFKITRIQNIILLDETFEKIDFPEEDAIEILSSTNEQWIEIRFKAQQSEAYWIMDEYSPEQITKDQEGNLYVQATFPDDSWVYNYFSSYGTKVEVLQPQSFRDELKKRFEKMVQLYS